MRRMAALHPEVVHFAIALAIVGVLFRAASLLGRPAFVSPAAATLLILGSIAVVLAAYTGDQAHGPIEQMPGQRPVVESHEAWGNRAEVVFVTVLILEVLALVAARWPWARYVMYASLVVGVIGVGLLYAAGKRGGEIVYGYAGGVGTRSGNPEDVQHLLLAGLYQQAMLDRRNGRAGAAAALIDEAAQRFPDNIDVQLLKAESLLVDRKDAAASLQALRAIAPPTENRALRVQHALLTADALVAAGQRDGAIATLQQVQAEVNSPRVQQRLDALQGRQSPAR
jgi:uncharacterized membrane protein